jgi:hypothetical protein
MILPQQSEPIFRTASTTASPGRQTVGLEPSVKPDKAKFQFGCLNSELRFKEKNAKGDGLPLGYGCKVPDTDWYDVNEA